MESEISNLKSQILVVVIDLAGGTGTFCRLLAGGLRKYFPDEFDLSLLLLRDKELTQGDHKLFDPLVVLGTEVHNNWRRIYETPLHALALRRALAGMRADIVFTVGTYANLLVPRVEKRPTILSVHAHASTQLGKSRFGRLIESLSKRGYRRNPVVVPARGVADDLRLHFDAGDVRIIPHGVDAEHVRQAAEETPEDLPKAPYFVAVGRLATQKDYPTLLEAYAEARRRGVNHDLLIVGEGDKHAEIENLRDDLSLGEHVRLIGHRANPFPYMKHARAFVLSSIWEGFGLVLIEAMALGIPCISTDCPAGPGDILDGGRCGILTPVRDVQALAGAMERLAFDDTEHARLSAAASARAGELSLEAMAGAYRELFRAAR